jgi:hypothetical protein
MKFGNQQAGDGIAGKYDIDDCWLCNETLYFRQICLVTLLNEGFSLKVGKQRVISEIFFHVVTVV